MSRMIRVSLCMVCLLGIVTPVSAMDTQKKEVTYYEAQRIDDETLIRMAKEGIYVNDGVNIVNSYRKTENGVTIETIQVTHKEQEERYGIQSVKATYSTRAQHTLTLDHNTLHATIVQEATYDSKTFGGYTCYKILSYGHRLSYYNKEAGAPASLSSNASQKSPKIFSSNGTSVSTRTESTSFTSNSNWANWTRQNSGFSYYMADYGDGYAKVSTTLSWRNTSGSTSSFTVNANVFQ